MNRVLACILFVLVAAFATVTGAFAQGVTGETTPVDQLSDFALWGIVGGAATSLITAAINRQRWPSEYKLGMFLFWCCVTAALDAHFLRTLDLHNWSRALLIVVGSGWTTYLAAKPAIKSIEAKTG